MASVNDYLKKLLYQYDCVVVPELGAFLTHYQSAAFTETSGLYLPPRKRVAFNEALRFDDGILANYIMLHEPLTREGAQQHISLFVSELRKQVKTTGRFELDGIGTFTHNDESRLQFDPSLRHNFYGETYGMSPISAQLVDRQPQLQPALEAVPVTALGPVIAQEENATLTPYRPARPYWRVAAIAILVGSLGVLSYFSVVNPGQPLQSSFDPANLLRVPALFSTDAVTKTETSKRVAHKTVPVPVAVVKPTAIPAKPVTVAPPTGQISAKTVVTPVKVKLEAVPTTKPEIRSNSFAPAVKPVRTGPYFTVIAGVFSSKRNALRLKRQLRKAGYSDAFVIMPSRGRRGQLYKVAAAGSAIRDEAIASMDAVNKIAGSGAWIYKN